MAAKDARRRAGEERAGEASPAVREAAAAYQRDLNALAAAQGGGGRGAAAAAGWAPGGAAGGGGGATGGGGRASAMEALSGLPEGGMGAANLAAVKVRSLPP